MNETTTVEATQPVTQEQPAFDPRTIQHLIFPGKEEYKPEVASEEVVAAPAETPVVDFKTYFKEHFDVDDPEVLKKEYSELKAFKANPPKEREEIKFANDEAKKYYDYLVNDKVEELSKSLNGRLMVRDIESKSEEEKVKLLIRMKNSLYTDDMVTEEFEELYKVNEKDFEDEDGNIVDPRKLDRAKVKAKQQLLNAAQEASEYFKQFQTKIELPEITKSAPDEGYAAYLKAMEEAPKYDAEIKEFYSKLTPKDASLSFKFNDEASKLAFDFAFEPEKDGFSKTVQLVSNMQDFFDSYANQDGSPDRLGFAKDVYFAKNKERILTEVAKSAVNAYKKSVIERETTGSGGQRENIQTEQSELDKLKALAFPKY